MSRYIEVAEVNSLPPGKCRSVVVGNHELAVGNINGSFFAVADACPHAGASLGGGELQGDHLVCPLHAWKFKPLEGSCTSQSASRVARYATRVIDGHLEVLLPE